MRPIDADALMEIIRAHDYPLRSHFNSTDMGMFTSGIQQAVDEQPTVSAPCWHRVEEKPKEEKQEYLICTNKGYMCSCRWTNNVYGFGVSDRWGWCIVDIPQFQKVAYWMPKPPLEEKT